jgi:2-oxo-4-hydroxy-4-carboxy--5-ureidoimidazoline (OHCU) decarboxylase
MDREEIIRMAREAGLRVGTNLSGVVLVGSPAEIGLAHLTIEELERFAALIAAAERENLAAWMIERGYATGHGDSTEDLLKELEWQIEESVRNEREACAKVVEDYCGAWDNEGYALATAIRARSGK